MAFVEEKVDFIVAGAQKSGTTALRHFLREHPEIGLPTGGGEAHFFDKHSAEAANGNYDAYHAMYTSEALTRCTGDVTPIYLYRTDCLPAIRRYNPDMKIIVLLRDPAARAYSQWVMEAERGKETRRFLPALLHEAKYYRQHGQHSVYSYVQRGFYDAQITRLQALFPAENVLILRNEDLRHHHENTLRRVFRFLDVQDSLAVPRSVVHSREYDAMPRLARRLLIEVYRRDIKRLQRRLGWDCSSWLRV